MPVVNRRGSGYVLLRRGRCSQSCCAWKCSATTAPVSGREPAPSWCHGRGSPCSLARGCGRCTGTSSTVTSRHWRYQGARRRRHGERRDDRLVQLPNRRRPEPRPGLRNTRLACDSDDRAVAQHPRQPFHQTAQDLAIRDSRPRPGAHELLAADPPLVGRRRPGLGRMRQWEDRPTPNRPLIRTENHPPLPGGLFGGLLFKPSTAEDGRHAVIPLVTRVLVEQILVLYHWHLGGPWSHPCRLIGDRVLVDQRLRIQPREPLGQRQALARAQSGATHLVMFPVEIGGFDDERLAVPVGS